MKRIASSPEMDPATEQNKNIQWAHGTPLMFFYLGVIFCCRFVLSFLVGIPGSWTCINIAHTVVTGFFLHWLKGVPFTGLEFDQGRFDHLTLWEQFDNGAQYTVTKKFLTIVPIVLFLVTIYFNDFDGFPFAVNFLFLVPVLVPKLPFVQQLLGKRTHVE